MKKLIALVLALVMMFALCACTGGGNAGTSGEASLDPLTKDDVIKITVTSAPSWPFNENWKVWEYIREGVGATLEINAIPEGDVGTKLPLLFADAEQLPDLLHKYGNMRDYINSGAIIPFEDVQEYMPNAVAFYDSLPEAEYDNIVTLNRHADGKLYWFVHHGREQSRDVQAWLYREDIFRKHNLKVPTTFDELYEVSKELKKLYPDSYPYCMREGLSRFNTIGQSFEKDWNTGIYYKYDTGEWGYGYKTDTMREIIEFHIKMIEEGLLMPNFVNIPTNSWQELVTTDRGFIMPEYQTRIDFFNGIARQQNPDFNLIAMAPPVANPEKGAALVSKTNVEKYGFSICNSRDERRIANAAKYLDWFYTDEATELVSWGKEGETYEVVDGKKQYIYDDAGTQIQSLYGFDSNGSFVRMNTEALLSSESDDIAATRDMVLSHIAEQANAAGRIAFTEEESTELADITAAAGSYASEMVNKFLIKQEPISKWDEYVATLEELIDFDRYFEIYDTAYQRIANK